MHDATRPRVTRSPDSVSFSFFEVCFFEICIPHFVCAARSPSCAVSILCSFCSGQSLPCAIPLLRRPKTVLFLCNGISMLRRFRATLLLNSADLRRAVSDGYNIEGRYKTGSVRIISADLIDKCINGIILHNINRASAESASGHPGANHPRNLPGFFRQHIQLFAGNLENHPGEKHEMHSSAFQKPECLPD